MKLFFNSREKSYSCGFQVLAKLGDIERIDACNTLQVKNYDRYEMDAMNPEGRKKYNAEHWEEELQQAFDAGKRMAEKIKANAEQNSDSVSVSAEG